MATLSVSHDTSDFEVAAVLDETGQLTDVCARKAYHLLDRQGFVILTGLLSPREATEGLRIVCDTIDDPKRERGSFASNVDIEYGRRDFCPLPANDDVMSFAAKLCRRAGKVLTGFCSRTRPVVEISTLTSYRGSSHQYVHRDPYGIICMFAAVDDISPAQGGTVFVPGTQSENQEAFDNADRSGSPATLFQTRCNMRILRHNLTSLWRMRHDERLGMKAKEFRDRVFSRRYDNHQPNLLRFFTGKNPVFDLSRLRPSALWSLFRQRNRLNETFRLVQAAPKKGAVILYRSDMLHAGPDNKSDRPRLFFSMSILRDDVSTDVPEEGYSPHSSLVQKPTTLGDLLDRGSAPT